MIFLQIRPFEPGDRAVFFTMAREFYRSPAVLHPSPDDCFARTFDALMAGTPYADGFLIESEFESPPSKGDLGGCDLCLFFTTREHPTPTLPSKGGS